MSSLDFNMRMDYCGDAVSGVATKNTTTDFDLKITSSRTYVSGGKILHEKAVWGDYIQAQVIDIDNVLGYGPNTVLKNYIVKRYIDPSTSCDLLEIPYGGQVPTNTYLRIKYTSIGTVDDVNVAINYHLHNED